MFSQALASHRTAVLAVFLFAVYGVSTCGQAASAPLSLKTAVAPQAKAAATPSTQEESAPLRNDASHQSIKVHGHWKIVVTNPDGSIAQTHEFENSLTSNGAGYLAAYLGGQLVSGGMAIALNTSGTSICNTFPCYIVSSYNSSGYGTGAAVCKNIAVTASSCATGMTTTYTANSIILAGQTTASQAGTITGVATEASECGGGASATSCSTGGPTIVTFTSTPISSVSVNSGQIVQVTVTISFS